MCGINCPAYTLYLIESILLGVYQVQSKRKDYKANRIRNNS